MVGKNYQFRLSATALTKDRTNLTNHRKCINSLWMCIFFKKNLCVCNDYTIFPSWFSPASWLQLIPCALLHLTVSDNIIIINRGYSSFSIFLFLVFLKLNSIQILYIPCLIAICKRIENACYKFMFVMGVLDVLSLCIYTIITAVLGIIGSVYCSAPEFNYVLGAFAMCMSDLGILFSLDDY